MEDVAMWIALEAVGGTGAGFGLRGPGEVVEEAASDCAGDLWCCDVILSNAFALPTGKGGGNGDIEIAVMDAE
jgi:hypothetical protein